MRKRTVIDASSSAFSLDLGEFLQYRDLFLTLAHRDLRVRYAQSFLGILWAFMQPAITLCIFTLIFSQALSVETGGVPYPLYASAGLIAWTFFAYVMTNAGGSIIGAQSMIKKIYFPRLIIGATPQHMRFANLGAFLHDHHRGQSRCILAQLVASAPVLAPSRRQRGRGVRVQVTPFHFAPLCRARCPALPLADNHR